MVQLLDQAGIRRAAVLSLAYSYGNPNRPPVEREYELAKAENDWTSSQVALFPDRLVAFCSVNPLKDYALDEIARCAQDPRLRRGLKLHFGNSDVNLTDPQHAARLREVFALANRHGMAIVVHARTTISKERPYGAAHARAFLTLLEAAPDVPVQIAHLAGAGSYDTGAVDEALGVFVDAIAAKDRRTRRLYFDVSGVAGLGEWKAAAPRIAERIRQLGVDRILYGSDGAGGGNLEPAAAWQAFTELPLTPAEIETVRTNLAPYLR
jgi:predicted TIM-barrel fold metal-dependent hydrolase